MTRMILKLTPTANLSLHVSHSSARLRTARGAGCQAQGLSTTALPPDMDDDGLSRLVFIIEGIERDRIKELLRRLATASARRHVRHGLASLLA